MQHMFTKVCTSGVTRKVTSVQGFDQEDLVPSPIEDVWVMVQPTSEVNEVMSHWTGTAIHGHAALVTRDGGMLSEELLAESGDSIVDSILGLASYSVAA